MHHQNHPAPSWEEPDKHSFLACCCARETATQLGYCFISGKWKHRHEYKPKHGSSVVPTHVHKPSTLYISMHLLHAHLSLPQPQLSCSEACSLKIPSAQLVDVVCWLPSAKLPGSRTSDGINGHSCYWCVQHCIWRLGAPMVAMFLGLRLVFSVSMSAPVLGHHFIQTGLQVRGEKSELKLCYLGIESFKQQLMWSNINWYG